MASNIDSKNLITTLPVSLYLVTAYDIDGIRGQWAFSATSYAAVKYAELVADPEARDYFDVVTLTGPYAMGSDLARSSATNLIMRHDFELLRMAEQERADETERVAVGLEPGTVAHELAYGY